MAIGSNNVSTEEKIFEAALQVFCEKGKAAARMQEIANRAGINKALLHYYFRNKDTLYEKIFEHIFSSHFLELSTLVQEDQTAEEGLYRFISCYIDILNSNPLFSSFILKELNSGGETLIRKIRQLAATENMVPPNALARFLKHHHAHKHIVAGDPIQVLMTIFGACIYPFIARPIFDLLSPVHHQQWSDFIEQRKKEVFATIYYGLKPRVAESISPVARKTGNRNNRSSAPMEAGRTEL